MPNTYFRFKEFTVHQDKTAMKVCTDACLFGAWLANALVDQSIVRMLDIGAGTGLLSLMIAQKVNAHIDAVEIDETAYSQAKQNFDSSPWNDRLTLFHTRIQDYKPHFKYDVIFSNPPFYEGDLRSPDEKRSLALHSSDLTFGQFLESVTRLLKPGGKLALLLPESRSELSLKKYNYFKLNLRVKVSIRQSRENTPFRQIHLLDNTMESTMREEEIDIRESVSGGYTAGFRHLLSDYYLQLR
jgi:tRNA1Val (adenine37-N6)-methyltransferase